MKNHEGSLAAAIAFFGVSLLMPAVASAQRTSPRIGGGTMVRMTTAPARTFVQRAPVSGVRVNVSRSVVNRSISPVGQSPARHRADALGFNGGFASAPLSLQDLLNITPNSGFNWEHVNAINSDLPEKALIDPVTQLEIAQAERLLRTTGGATFGGGAYILGGYPSYVPTGTETEQANPESEQLQAEPQSAPNSQPQIIVLQQAPSQQSAASTTQAAPAEQQLPDRGELTLVLRSGEHVRALAFTHLNDKIVYIAPDGGRTTIEAADLDSAATVRINQEQGTPLQLPL